MKNKSIKEIRQKNSSAYSSPVPIGAYGINIDMLSENNLEEEFHLGGQCITNFETDDDGNMIITEEYRKENQTENYYSMVTTFEVENNDTIITQKLYFYPLANSPNLERTKTVVFSSSGTGMTIKEEIS